MFFMNIAHLCIMDAHAFSAVPRPHCIFFRVCDIFVSFAVCFSAYFVFLLLFSTKLECFYHFILLFICHSFVLSFPCQFQYKSIYSRVYVCLLHLTVIDYLYGIWWCLEIFVLLFIKLSPTMQTDFLILPIFNLSLILSVYCFPTISFSVFWFSFQNLYSYCK